MIEIIKKIMSSDFVLYSRVYELAAREGLSKSQVKQAKLTLGIKTVTLVKDDKRLWLWYIPENIWNKYSS